MSDTRVTSAELRKSFCRCRERAQQEPVVVTKHGRDSLVLLSIEEYRRLKSQDRKALFAWELRHSEIEALQRSDAISEGAEFNHEYTRTG